MIAGNPNYAPGSYDPLTHQPRSGRWATEREMETLAYLAASGAPVQSATIGIDLAHEGESLSAGASHARGAGILNALKSLQLVVGRGSYELTERGRIAAALILARHPGMLAAFFDLDALHEAGVAVVPREADYGPVDFRAAHRGIIATADLAAPISKVPL